MGSKSSVTTNVTGNVAVLAIREDPRNAAMVSPLVAFASSCTCLAVENESTMNCPQERTLQGK